MPETPSAQGPGGDATAYVTTPIYYVNDRPHIGHVYTTTLCDVWARFMRLAGRDTFFLTGTDEHGVKVEKSATARGVTPQALADENSAEFRKAMGLFGLSNDDFIRTTDADHERQVQAFIRQLRDKDVVYLGEFEGWYDEGEEEYVPENRAREHDYKSPQSGRPLVRATERNWYFRLSAFQERLETLFAERPDFVQPAARRNEVLGRLRDGLQDVPISRTNFSWGIPMPDQGDGDDVHVIYVWIDALFNYATALGLAEPDSDRNASRAKYWPADYHVIGKEILWFHAVIWPALIMALELPLPKRIHAHGFWISEGRKMSKSEGNFIDLEALQSHIETYGLDMLRWYLVTEGPIGAQDADFRVEHVAEVYGAALVNTFGNCTSRTTAMINKYFDGAVPTEAPNGDRIVLAETDWPAKCAYAVARAREAMADFDLGEAMDQAMSLVRAVDQFINDTEPFRLAKDESKRDELGAILYQCLEALRIAAILLSPTLTTKVPEFLAAIARDGDLEDGAIEARTGWGGIEPGTMVSKVALYPRL